MTWSFKMKKVMLVILAGLFLFGGTAFGAKASKTKYRAFTPTGAGKSVFIKSGAKQHKYFVVEKGVSYGFDVTGPTKIKIRTRAEIKPGILNVDYETQVWEADKLIADRKIKTQPSTLVLEGQQVGIGQVQSITVKVPKGKHTYRLWIASEKSDRCYVQFLTAKASTKKALGYKNYKPFEFKNQVNLKTSKGSIAYYLVDGTGGATVHITGPTKLRILCRANYNKDMKGKTKFTLGIFENGTQVTQLPGAVKVSTKSTFKELPDMVPSLIQVFNFNVPAGKHSYEFRKLDSAAPTLAIKFKIQESTLGLKL